MPIQTLMEAVAFYREFAQAMGRSKKTIAWVCASVRHPFNRPQDKPLQAMSIVTYVRGLQSYFSFLVRQGIILRSPLSQVGVPRAPQKPVRSLSEDRMEPVLKAPHRKTPTGFRDFTIILVFLDTLLRLSRVGVA